MTEPANRPGAAPITAIPLPKHGSCSWYCCEVTNIRRCARCSASGNAASGALCAGILTQCVQSSTPAWLAGHLG